FGRPPKERAGEVEERILDAAHKIFLARGFEGASVEEIAEAARAGKPTIYARFGDKRALFTAVMMRDDVSRIEQFAIHEPNGTTRRGAALERSGCRTRLEAEQRTDGNGAARGCRGAALPRSREHRESDGA